MKKRIVLLLFVILLTFSLAFTACGGAARTAPGTSPSAPGMGGGERNFSMLTEAQWADSAPMPAMEEAAVEFEYMAGTAMMDMDMPPEASAREAATTQRMIITTFSLTAETMDFDGSRDFIRAATNEFGGYISGSWEGGRGYFDAHRERDASFTLRIPSGRVHEFVSLMGENTNIVGTSVHTEDITDSFFDNQARLASLVNQEGLLVGLLEVEGAGLEYILEVHRELANVRHQIEALNSWIQQQEHSVSYSTVTISLREVIQYRPVHDLPTTFGERISQATSNSWTNFVRQTQNMLINLIFRLPMFLLNLLIIVFGVAVFLFVRKIIRKKKGSLPGENTFEWLPIGKIRKGEVSENSETGSDNN